MKFRSMSIKYSYVIICLLISIPTLSFSMYSHYQDKKSHIIERAYDDIGQSQEIVKNSIANTEKNYELVAMFYEARMKEALEEFREAYDASGMVPENIDLDELKSAYNNLMDFYIINQEGKILYSTFSPALGLDFSAFPTFFSNLTKIRNEDEITISKVTTDLKTRELRKWGYISSSDHKHVLEVGINSEAIGKYFEKLDYKTIESEILETNPLVKDTNVYDQRYTRLGYDIKVVDRYIVSDLAEAFNLEKDKMILDKGGYPMISYHYLETFPYSMEDAKKVIEIHYDFTGVVSELKAIRETAIFTGVMYIFLSAVLVYFITTRFITDPIVHLSDEVKKIAPNNLNFDFRYDLENEIGVLVNSFEKMTKNLNNALVSNEYFNTLLDSFGDFMVVLDTDFKIRRVNDTLSEYLSFNTDYIYGKSIDELLLEPIDKSYYVKKMNEEGTIQNVEQVFVNRDGESTRVLTSMNPIKDREGEIEGYILNSTNITKIKENINRLEALNDKLMERERVLLEETNRDYLTKAYNRSFSMKKIEDLVEKRLPFSIIMCDVDNFKKINDTYGHPTGDRILVEFAERIKHLLRDKEYLCRYGGEEFLIIVQEKSIERVREIAERIRAAIQEHIFMDGIRTTLSCGVEVYDSKYSNIEEFIRAADNKMYLAKKSGRNKVVI